MTAPIGRRLARWLVERRAVLIPLVLLWTGCAPRLVVAPAGAPPTPIDRARASVEQLDSVLGRDHFTEAAKVRLPGETVLSGPELQRLLDGSAESSVRMVLKRPIQRLYMCEGYALEVGRVRVERTFVNGTARRYEARWHGEWVRGPRGEWQIREARVGSGMPWRMGVAAGCVTAAEQQLAERRRALVIHAPQRLAAAGGLLESISTELEFDGWDGEGCQSTPCAGQSYPAVQPGRWISGSYRHRLWGGWGVEAVGGRESGRVRGYSTDLAAEALMRAWVTYTGLLATYELRYLRLGVGPVWVWSRSEGTLTDGSGTAASSHGMGWLNQAAVTIPVTGRFYVDLAFQDRLFGDGSVATFGTDGSTDPGAAVELRQSGSAVVVGVGVKF